MLTKSQFSEKVQIWFRVSKGHIDINYTRAGASGRGAIIPIDENLVLYSGDATLVDGAIYRGNSNGYLTYTGTQV